MPTYKYRWNHPRAHEPFPELQSWTYARVTPVSSGTLTNASTTKIARFMLVLLDAETITMPRQPVAACSIRVTHVRGDSARANAPSRIRVDGLSLKLSSCATQCIAMRHANHAGGNMSRARLNDSTARCSAGASERRRGFLSRQCVGCDSDVKGMTVQGRALTPFPRRGSSSEPSMAVGALGRPPGAPPGSPGSARWLPGTA